MPRSYICHEIITTHPSRATEKKNAEFQLFVNLNSFRIDIQTCTIYTNRSQTPPHRCHIHYIILHSTCPRQKLRSTKAHAREKRLIFLIFFYRTPNCLRRPCVQQSIVAKHHETIYICMYKYTTYLWCAL